MAMPLEYNHRPPEINTESWQGFFIWMRQAAEVVYF